MSVLSPRPRPLEKKRIKRAFFGEEVEDARFVSLLNTKTIKYYPFNYIT